MSSTEELVGLVLAALHPRLRERCTESKILAVLEEDCGAYDIKTLRTLLETRHGFDTVAAKLEQQTAAPLAFLTEPVSLFLK